MTALLSVPPVYNRAIHCYGDSLTVGTSGWSYTASGRWPVRLSAMFRPPRPTYNFGGGGETAAQIKTRFLARTDRSPKFYIFWAGRNGVLDTTLSTIIADIQSMIDDIGTGSNYLVLTVPPKTDGTEDPGDTNGDKVIALNALIMAAWPGHVLDINVTIGTDSGDRTDNVHLTEACQLRVAQAIYAQIVVMGA